LIIPFVETNIGLEIKKQATEAQKILFMRNPIEIKLEMGFWQVWKIYDINDVCAKTSIALIRVDF
jgi:hypothetical protein